jgi:hypothetical protein
MQLISVSNCQRLKKDSAAEASQLSLDTDA